MVRSVLSRFVLLFDAPREAQENWSDAVDCWVRLMPQGMTDDEFSKAAAVLARTLTRFPTPADFLAHASASDEVAGAQKKGERFP